MAQKKPLEDKHQTIDDLPVDEFQQKMAHIADLVAQLTKATDDFVTLTSDDRIHSEGRIRPDESKPLGVLLDISEKFPQYFMPLADKEDGHDPNRFESELVRARLAKRDAIAEVVDSLEKVSTRIRDTSLYFGERSKPVLLAGYRILKPVAEHDTALRSMLAPVIQYYSRPRKRTTETE